MAESGPRAEKTAGSSRSIAGWRPCLLICLILAAATVAVYWRGGGGTLRHHRAPTIFFLSRFVPLGFTWESVAWSCTTCYYEYWHPLMWWSHMLDCQLFGMNA